MVILRSPWYSIPSKTFGLDTSPDVPDGCAVTALHLLHRHGARYPTTWCKCVLQLVPDSFTDISGSIPLASFAGPASFAAKLRNVSDSGVKWKAKGSLDFLNNWTYKLGGELLTPFGRQQLCEHYSCYSAQPRQPLVLALSR